MITFLPLRSRGCKVMSKFSQVTEILKGVPYMNEERADTMRSLIDEIDAADVLELGFFQGKSTAYFAAILEDRGKGHVTAIDLSSAKKRSPNIHENLSAVSLSHRVTPIFAKRSYTWEMARMIKRGQKFDFCYLDGGHTWDMSGFGFLLVDMLLRPGGIIVLDDVHWTIANRIEKNPNAAAQYAKYDEDELQEPAIKLVWETIVPHLGYARTYLESFDWGVARKPVN